MNQKRSRLALVPYKDKLFAIGGYVFTTDTILSCVEMYDLDSNAWQFVESMPEAAAEMAYGLI